MDLRTNTAQPLHSYGQMQRGFRPLYHADTVNHCPGCGHTAWHIGRSSAECAHCETAIPLAHAASQPERPLFHVTCSATAMAA
jgi:hypothetical protein